MFYVVFDIKKYLLKKIVFFIKINKNKKIHYFDFLSQTLKRSPACWNQFLITASILALSAVRSRTVVTSKK